MSKEQAKNLFWEYACNYFFMDHDGVLEEYVKLGGNPRRGPQEKIWYKEYIEYWLDQLDTSNDETRVMSQLRDAGAFEVLPILLKKRTFSDDFSKLWYIITLLSLVELYHLEIAERLRTEIFSRIKEVGVKLLDAPLSLTSNSRLRIQKIIGELKQSHGITVFSKKELQTELTAEDYIRARTKGVLRDADLIQKKIKK